MTNSRLLWGYSLSPLGFSEDAWHGGRPSNLGIDALLRQVDSAKHAGFDFVALFDRLGARPGKTIVSGNATFEPTTLVSALSSRARDIGFLAAASTVHHEVYNLARRFASLDTINDGRTGWIVLDDSGSPERDLEYVDVVKGLWNSWDADAFIYDKKAGRFFDPEKMHVLDHRGPHLSVRGPLNVNRSPQDTPVIAAVHGYGNPVLAARHAEIIVLQSTSVEAVKLDVGAIRGLIATEGRQSTAVRIMVALIPFDGREGAPSDAGAQRSGGPGGLRLPEMEGDIATVLKDLASETYVDGFVIVPPSLEAAAKFVSEAVPKLASLGLGGTKRGEGTLRSTLFGRTGEAK